MSLHLQKYFVFFSRFGGLLHDISRFEDLMWIVFSCHKWKRKIAHFSLCFMMKIFCFIWAKFFHFVYEKLFTSECITMSNCAVVTTRHITGSLLLMEQSRYLESTFYFVFVTLSFYLITLCCQTALSKLYTP